MLDREAFYNEEDMWDLARYTAGQEGQPEAGTPTYVVASLPHENQAEFMLLLPFTPRNKDNLIGLMLARCDGEHLGEIVVLQLSKQELIFGPAQIAARINQEQTISKDLTLWNQQGSHVLRAQTLVLPVDSTFLYVDSIYIQSPPTRRPTISFRRGRGRGARGRAPPRRRGGPRPGRGGGGPPPGTRGGGGGG